jgi:hypothetical protein
MPSDGILSAIVWPTHVGAVNADGIEPMHDHDYRRGQIRWGRTIPGNIIGRATVLVPAGEWTHIVYCYHPTKPVIVQTQKLAHPLVLAAAGDITLDGIGFDDVCPTPGSLAIHV